MKVIDKAAEHEGKKVDEKDKEALRKKMDAATDVSAKGNEVARKVQSVSNQINDVVNSPEANIVGDIVGGSFQDKLKSVQNAVNSTNHAVNTFVGPKPANNHAQQEVFSFESRKLQQGPLGESVVTSIQAIDQYGNIIAQARNPKLQ